MARPKVEFPPILPLGRHPFTVDSLRVRRVDAFPTSKTRVGIMNNLSDVVSRLQTAGVTGDLWIDGSFLTTKINPKDVDIALRMQGLAYDSASPAVRSAVDWLGDNLILTHKVDSYVFFVWPDGHPLFWYGEYGYVYWMKQWGFSRGDKEKGVAEIKLP